MPAPGKSRKRKTRKQKLRIIEQQRLIQKLINEAKDAKSIISPIETSINMRKKIK